MCVIYLFFLHGSDADPSMRDRVAIMLNIARRAQNLLGHVATVLEKIAKWVHGFVRIHSVVWFRIADIQELPTFAPLCSQPHDMEEQENDAQVPQRAPRRRHCHIDFPRRMG